MNSKIYPILLLIIIIFVGGCGKSLVTNTQIPSTFAGNINFRINEQFTGDFDGPHLYLDVSTEESYPCYNYTIENSVYIKDNTIKLILGNIIKPSICLTAIGPAGFYKDLNLKTGIYTLEFQSKTAIDEYSIEVSKDNLIIEPIRRTFSKTEQRKTDRIPENLLWVNCFYNSDWKYNPWDDFCERFFNEIETFARPYLIAEKGKIPRNQFYLYTGEERPLINLIQKYNREKFYVNISIWQGKKFICPFYCEKPGIADVPEVKISYLSPPKTTTAECEGSDNQIICFMEVAFYSKNEKICEQLPKESQGQCFGQVGIAKLDETLCAKAGGYSTSEECYSYIAIQKSNPDLCERLTSIYRDDCYISYAESKNDKSFCDKVVQPGRIQWCLDNFK